jgi:hypothetical protein
MSVGVADIHQAVYATWLASGLDAKFTALWPSGVTVADYTVLNDQEASPNQPWPYCVFSQTIVSVTDRMSGGTNHLRQIHDVPWEFHVHAKLVDGDARSGKQIAAYLVEEMMKVYGGHPTSQPTAPTLDNGNFLIAQYQSDYVIREGEDEWQWLLNYILRVDVPVRV